MLGLKFAYATNGKGIVEFDFTTGKESETDEFPKPLDLWNRVSFRQGCTRPGSGYISARNIPTLGPANAAVESAA